MNKFVFKVIIYLLCFVLVMFGLSSLDFNKLIKQNKVNEARVLYLILSMVITYLLGSFLMDIIYYFN